MLLFNYNVLVIIKKITFLDLHLNKNLDKKLYLDKFLFFHILKLIYICKYYPSH